MSIDEWLQRGGVGLEDLKDMVVFPVNPLTDFAVDLAELWKMQCSVDEMLKMGIHYDHLVAKGITPAIMAAFRLPLSSWVDLGTPRITQQLERQFTSRFMSVKDQEEKFCTHQFARE